MGFVNSVDFYFSFFVCFRVVFLGYLHGRMVIGFAVEFRLFYCWLFVRLWWLFGLLSCVLVCVLLVVGWLIVGGIFVDFVVLVLVVLLAI